MQRQQPERPNRDTPQSGSLVRLLDAARGHAPALAAVFAALALLGAYGKLAPLAFWSIAALAAGVLFAVAPSGRAGDEPAAASRHSGRTEASPSTAAHWAAIVDALPDGAFLLDSEARVVQHNRAAAEIFQQMRRGRPLIQATRNPDLAAAVDRARDPSQPFASAIEVSLAERVPLERRITAIVARLPASGTRLPDEPAVLVICNDLTEQDRLAQMRADFIANASHELRTPLASLRGFIETLQGPARDDPKARERFLGIMSAQAERMTRLIDDLLSLSRVEMRAHLPPKGTVDLNEIASHVTQTLEPIARDAGVTLSVGRLSGPAPVRGDRDELVQVAQNLLQNAIKYGRAGGTARIEIVREPQASPLAPKLAIVVTDDGPGIAPEHLPRLTERFYRVSATASRDKGGTGLGLAIVKHIVSRHQGRLEIASRVGSGSMFKAIFDEDQKSA